MRSALTGLLTAFCLAAPLGAQGLVDRYRESYRGWELLLEKGQGTQTRRAVEALIQRDGALTSTADYNEMRALVGLYDMAARACVLEGAWEDAVSYLKKALDTATLNQEQAQATLGRIRREHEAKLPSWREAVQGLEARLKAMDELPGLTEQMLKDRTAMRVALEDHKSAIAHSERSLKEMDSILAALSETRTAFQRSQAEWTGFLDREKQELAQAGSPARYVEDRLEQVKGDETRPRQERISYTRRLLRLEPENAGAKALLASLNGGEADPMAAKEAAKEAAKANPAPKKKARSRKKR